MLAIPGAVSAKNLSRRHGLTALIYGYYGAGKTKLVSGIRRVPKHAGRILWYDCEAGAITIGGMEGIEAKRITTWQQMQAEYKWLNVHATELGHMTIVIDTLTNLQRLGLNALAGSGEQIGVTEYNRSNEQIGGICRSFVDFADAVIDPETGEIVKFGWNIIFICHLATKENKILELTLSQPALTPKAAEQAGGIVDMVGLLQSDHLSGRRVLIMQNTGSTLGKFRMPADRPAMPTKLLVPDDTLDNGLANPDFEPVFARIMEHYHGEIDLNDRVKWANFYPKPKKATEEAKPDGSNS